MTPPPTPSRNGINSMSQQPSTPFHQHHHQHHQHQQHQHQQHQHQQHQQQTMSAPQPVYPPIFFPVQANVSQVCVCRERVEIKDESNVRCHLCQ